MKEYQDLIGKIIIAAAIVIAGALVAQAVMGAGQEIASHLSNLGTLVRDGLLQAGSAS